MGAADSQDAQSIRAAIRFRGTQPFHSSLRLAEDSLVALGIPAENAAHSVEVFREYDERNLVEAHAIYRNGKQSIQSLQQAAEELTSLFEANRRGEARCG